MTGSTELELWFGTTETSLSDGSESVGDENRVIAARDRILASVYIFLGVLGFLGNTFVVTVMVRHRVMLKQVTNIYILNQSVIDSVCALILIFTYIFNGGANRKLEGIAGDLMCRIWITTAPLWAMMDSSSANLIAVTFERYLAVTRPIWHKTRFTRERALMSLPFLWLAGPVLNGAYTIPPHKVVQGKCYVFSEWASETWRIVGSIYIFMLQLLVPLIIFAVCYGRMAYVLGGRKKVAPSSGGVVDPELAVAGQSKYKEKAQANIIKILFIVVVCFVCCWGINQFYFLLFNLGLGYPYIDLQGNVFHFSVFLTFLNCCINPFIYAAKYKQFQEGVRHLLGFQKKAAGTSSHLAKSTKTTTTTTRSS